MATGTVKWFKSDKGYGFIQPIGGGGKDVFVTYPPLKQAGLSTLNEGNRSSYEIEATVGRSLRKTQGQVTFVTAQAGANRLRT